MREFPIQIIDEVIDGELTAKTEPCLINKAGIAGEHNASRLIFCLPDTWDITWEYRVECVNSSNEGATSDTLEVTESDGKHIVVFDIPQGMTLAGTANFTLEAAERDGDETVRIFRSATVDLCFAKSPKFSAKIANAIESVLSGLFAKINNLVERFNNGEFNGEKGAKGDTGAKGDKGDTGEKGADALINGYNAVTLKSGNNIRLTQQDNEITLDIERFPVCFDLPENAEYGDICLYAVPGIITENQSGKYVAVDWEGLKNAITPETAYDFILYKDGEEIGYVNATFGSFDETTVYDWAIMFESAEENWYISLDESGIDTKHSYHEKDGVKNYLTELPKIFRLPEFDRVETNIENVKDNILCTSLVPMYYFGDWRRFENDSCIPAVHTLPTDAKDGDMCLYSPANIIESGKRIYFDWEEFAKPVEEQEFTQLTYNAFANDISNEIEIMAHRNDQYSEFIANLYTIDSNKTLAVVFESGVLIEGWFTDDASQTPITSVSELPEYIEVYSFNYVQANELSGNAPLFYAPYRLMVYRAGEWHNANELFSTDCTAAEKVRIPPVQDPLETSLNPNVFYDFGERISVYIPELIEGDHGKRNEYMFSFISGETPTVLTMPSSVRWMNELVVEPNKKYEISIVDNIGLWCAVDLAVTAE